MNKKNGRLTGFNTKQRGSKLKYFQINKEKYDRYKIKNSSEKRHNTL
jgi:hypothetical protein